MHPSQRDRSLGDGVYFSDTDYIGPSRRIVIVCIDTVVLLVMGWGLSSAWVGVFGHDEGLISALVIMIWLYLVLLKRSAWRTVGYRVAGAKLVNLQGTRPALWLLTLRSLLWMFFFIPSNFLIDFLWCSVDDDRQSIRDRIANTCLVKHHAVPIGTGEVHIAYYFVLGYMFAYSHVVHPHPTHTVSATR
ncbi:MAG: RDD family protein [Nitrospira sp.]|nr:RDD family protein [Nitrospira sp.]MDH4242339.1 RDD family protein [Nitrospira sp.]MDH4358049.1 RDD family protein [Nitrospira sp.]MDH5318235.1 RDD family protein [Nitrospira sp.]